MALGMARTLLDLIFPPQCAGCGATGAEFCDACADKVRPLPAPRCVRCDTPLGSASPGGLCHPCASGDYAPALDRMTVAAVYEEPLRAAVHALKYQRRRRLAIPLAALALDAWRATGLRADVIIPMALHPTRVRQRGYNQSDLLARELARATCAPVRNDLLLRMRATTSQSRLTWEQRWSNVAGAFALAPAAAGALAGRRVLLVDDIITSGATTQAAASALREAGPAVIYALAVARPFQRAGE